MYFVKITTFLHFKILVLQRIYKPKKLKLMKKLFSFFVLFLLVVVGFAQVPGNLNYQAVIRDASGNLLTNSNVVLRFTITDGSNDYYQETQSLTTDAYGLVNVKVGEGIPESGTWNNIDWSATGLGLKTELQDGSSWVDLGTSTFSSVPYANHSASATNATNAVFADSAAAAPHLPIAMAYIEADNSSNTASVVSGYGISNVNVMIAGSAKYIYLHCTEDVGENPIIIVTPRNYPGTIIATANYNSGTIYINQRDATDLSTDIVHNCFIVIYKGE